MWLPVLIPLGTVFFGANLLIFVLLAIRRRFRIAKFVLYFNTIAAFIFGNLIAHEIEGLKNLLNLIGTVLGQLLAGP